MNTEELRTDDLEEISEELAEDLVEEEEPAAPLEPPKFVINTVINTEIQKEASEAAAPKGAKIVSTICYILLFASLVLVIIEYIRNRENTMLLMLGVVVLVIAYLIYNQLTMPKKALRRWEENMIRAFGTSELHLCAECYGLNMVQTLKEDKENVIIESYADLTGFSESEHLFLLRRTRQQYFFIAKDGFTTGTAEEFRAFIEENIGKKG